jgi:hypothetical protein
VTLDQVCEVFKARGHGKYRRAKCPVHSSGGLTLSIYEGKNFVNITCHAGCKYEDIVAAVGLKIRDLALRDRAPATQESRKKLQLERRLKVLYKAQLAAVFMAMAEPELKMYWFWEQKRIEAYWQDVWDELHPAEAAERKRMKKFHAAIYRLGPDEVMRRFMLTDKWKKHLESVQR